MVTDVRGRMRQVVLQDFQDNKELVEANMASVHVPFFLDWQPFAWIRWGTYSNAPGAHALTGATPVCHAST